MIYICLTKYVFMKNPYISYHLSKPYKFATSARTNIIIWEK